MIINPKRLCYKHKFVLGFLRALRTIYKHNHNNNKTSKTSPRQICKRYVKVKKAADVSMASAVGSTRAWSRALIRGQNRKKTHQNPNFGNYINSSVLLGFEENNNNKEIELRKLVPGGEAMDACNLLDETAHYIKCLNTQVKLMKGIADLYYVI